MGTHLRATGWDHTLLLATKRTCPSLTQPVSWDSIYLPQRNGRLCWHTAMHQPGVELAISPSQVRCPNHYNTELTMYIVLPLGIIMTDWTAAELISKVQLTTINALHQTLKLLHPCDMISL